LREAQSALISHELRPHLPRCRLDLARVLLARNGAGDVSEAQELLALGRAEAETMRLTGVLEWIDQALAGV
jgi:hypothetical protein